MYRSRWGGAVTAEARYPGCCAVNSTSDPLLGAASECRSRHAPARTDHCRNDPPRGVVQRRQASSRSIALTGRITQEISALQTLEKRLTDAQGAAARRKDLQRERDDTYGRVFEAIINEQNALAGLYAPLMARLAASPGTLNKLSFSVRRIADVHAWGSVAEEELLDRRKAGPFYGRGALIGAAIEALKPARPA